MKIYLNFGLHRAVLAMQPKILFYYNNSASKTYSAVPIRKTSSNILPFHNTFVKDSFLLTAS